MENLPNSIPRKSHKLIAPYSVDLKFPFPNEDNIVSSCHVKWKAIISAFLFYHSNTMTINKYLNKRSTYIHLKFLTSKTEDSIPLQLFILFGVLLFLYNCIYDIKNFCILLLKNILHDENFQITYNLICIIYNT